MKSAGAAAAELGVESITANTDKYLLKRAHVISNYTVKPIKGNNIVA